ncbi:hypothetical protein PA10_00234 [Pseudomonas phage pPa_SNUABM_DT01]|nr:hypothetical protein PA10_00234 [Pseudomonas phage pPa_SNUABM_DT01]
MDENEYPLKQWKSNELLKAACKHLLEQPEYVAMDVAQRDEMVRFAHALRRKLMLVVDKPDQADKDFLLRGFSSLYDIEITTDDHLRYVVTIHGYTFVFIMGIPLGDNKIHPAMQILFPEGRDS